ncbi:MAG: filamentous hemagglutinin N-terminal domain-containing protein [Opitutaceae bacterium]|nr:filamentous hemagglutinin N-terminal domain-containing protein [Opitutaceae bacterium]
MVVAPGATPGSSLWLGAAAPVQTQQGAQTHVDIVQQQAKAILTWESFNIGKETTLTFDQKGNTDWIALNRVTGADTNPSQILGQLKADGQVYIVNQNGVIFGGASQVNVGSLVASSLNISDENFQREFVTSNWQQTPTFAFDSAIAHATRTAPGNVTVEAGARIETDASGRVFLLGGNVTNHGTILTPDGQTLLASGQRAFLKASSESNLRGWEIEVAGNTAATGLAANTGEIIAERGNITLVGKDIEVSGRLAASTSVAANGSILLHARDDAFLDRDTITYQFTGIGYLRTGSVAIADGTVFDILPEYSSTDTVTAASLLDPSRIEIQGKGIYIGDGVTFVAPAGEISILSYNEQSPFEGLHSSDQNETRWAEYSVYIGKDTLIDMSGSLGVVVDGGRNFVEVELRGNELRDNPLLYDLLYGKKVWVDLRDTGAFDDPFMADVEWIEGKPGVWIGSPLFDATGYINQLRRGVGELTATGGNITVSAYGDIVVRDGAVLDVSGGTVNYTAAIGQVTRLVSANGAIVDVGNATWGENYTGIVGILSVDHGRWGVTENFHMPFVSSPRASEAYSEGKAAGTVTLSARRVALDGQVLAHVTLGERQVDNSAAPIGGSLILGNKNATRENPTYFFDYRLLHAELRTDDDAPLSDDFSFGDRLAEDFRTVLSTTALEAGGIGSLEIYGIGSIVMDEAASLDLGAGGRLVFAAPEVVVDGRIRAAGGSINLQAALGGVPEEATASAQSTWRPSLSVTLGAEAVLDVSGQWINDFLNPGAHAGRLAIRGGEIVLGSNELTPHTGGVASAGGPGIGTGVITLAEGSLIDVSGGGYVNPKGSLSRLGDAGSISVGASRLELGDGVSPYGGFQGYALATPASAARGGSLSLTSHSIFIGAGPDAVPSYSLGLDTGFFERGGFSDFALNGITPSYGQDGITLAVGAQVSLLPRHRLILDFDPSSDLFAGGAALSTLGGSVLLSEGHRAPSSLSLSAISWSWRYISGSGVAYPHYEASSLQGRIQLGEGSLIDAGIGGRVDLHSFDLITLAGEVRAPGGEISAVIKSGSGSSGSLTPRDRSIWVTIGSLIGENHENYRLAATGHTDGSLTITPRVLTIGTTGTVAPSKVYDGTTAIVITDPGLLANVVNNDTVSLVLTAAYADKNAARASPSTAPTPWPTTRRATTRWRIRSSAARPRSRRRT